MLHLKILIADANLDNVKLLEAAACKLGHAVTIAQNGQDAVEKFRTEDPDLVFMDVVLPCLDGIETARQMRTLPDTRWVPIIYFSTLDTTDDVVRGLDAGADDYLAKPASTHLIQAKITSYARILSIQRDVRGYMKELSDWRNEEEEQNRLGQYVVSRLLDTEGLRDPMLQWMNTPAQGFSGDLVCAARGPDDVLYAMLADASGHGLSASLTAMPMTQVFYGMANKGFPIHTIAEELNRKLKSFLPIEHFVAATLVAVDTRNQIIEIWNGGNPDALFLDDLDGTVAMRWPSRHPPLGIMPPSLFDADTETVNYFHPGELVMFSDGIIEAESPSGLRLNLQGLEAILCSAPKHQRLAALEKGVLQHLAERRAHDDLSSIVIQVPIERREKIRTTQTAAEAMASTVSDWRLELSWGATELRDMDIVPAVLGFMNQIGGLKPHQGQLFLILSELFNNAMDHGVLGLDSRLKNSEGGFELYLEERDRIMKALTDGHIGMSFLLHQPDGRPVLDIRMEDSGNGFDYTRIDELFDEHLEAHQTHGRGIRLIRSLCEEVVYSGRGNKVSVRYPL